MLKPDLPYDTAVKLFNPTYETVRGVSKKIYEGEGEVIFCKFKTSDKI